MAQRRTEKLLAYIEPILHTAVMNLMSKNFELGGKASHSEYVRNLIVEDLKRRNLLTDKMISENLC